MHVRSGLGALIVALLAFAPPGAFAKDCANCDARKLNVGAGGVTLARFVEDANGCTKERSREEFVKYAAGKWDRPIQQSCTPGQSSSFEVEGYHVCSLNSKLDREILEGVIETENQLFGKKEKVSDRFGDDRSSFSKMDRRCGDAGDKSVPTNADCVLGLLYAPPAGFYIDGESEIVPDKEVMAKLVRANYVQSGIFLSAVQRKRSESSLKIHWKPEEAHDFLELGEMLERLKPSGKDGMKKVEDTLYELDPIRVLANSSSACSRMSLPQILGFSDPPRYDRAVRFVKTSRGDGKLAGWFDTATCSILVKDQDPEKRRSVVPDVLRSLSGGYELLFEQVLGRYDNKDRLTQTMRAYMLRNWESKVKEKNEKGKEKVLLSSKPGDWKRKVGARFVSERARTSVDADFGETAHLYLSEPEKLRILDPARYRVLKDDIFQGVEFVGAYPKWDALETAFEGAREAILSVCDADFQRIRCSADSNGVLSLSNFDATKYACFAPAVAALNKKALGFEDYCTRSGKSAVSEWVAKRLLAEAHGRLSAEGRKSCGL